MPGGMDEQGRHRGRCSNLDARFRGQGFRWTLPRRVIVGILNDASGFLSAEEIFEEIQHEFPGIGLATVYRTLNLLSSIGLVSKFEFGEGKARYEIAEVPTDAHHHQLVCERCHKVLRYSDFSEKECSIHRGMEHALAKRYGFKIKRHVVQYYGVCAECDEAERKE